MKPVRSVTSRASTILPVLVYLVLTTLVTLPFLFRPTSTLTAPIGGDISTSVARWQVFSREGVNPYKENHLVTVGYPTGTRTSPGVDRVSALSTLVLWTGASTIGSVATHGMISFFGYLLTASVTFALVRRLTASSGAGFIAGIAFGFSQHMYVVNWAASLYSQMWLLMLPIWAFALLAESQSARRILLAGCSVLPAFFWTPYYALHVLVVAGACLATLATMWIKRRELHKLKLFAPILALWLVLLLVFWLIGLATSFTDVPHRSSTDAYEQSAHPLMFLTPTSKVWGTSPQEFLARVVPRAKGTALYLGLSVALLGLIGGIASVKSARQTAGRSWDPAGVTGVMSIAVVMFTFLFSLPPTVSLGPLRLPTPNYLVSSIVPAFRAGQRFVMPMMAGMSILAGLGAARLLRRMRGHSLAAAAGVISLIVWVDLWTRPLPATAAIPTSVALQRFAEMPAGATLHYPIELFRGEFFAIQVPCLLQSQHRKTLINVCQVAPETSLVTELRQSTPCQALVKAKAAGATYMILEKDSGVASCLADPALMDHGEVASDETFLIIQFAQSR